MSLLVLDPTDGRFYHYELMAGWEAVPSSAPSEPGDASTAGLTAAADTQPLQDPGQVTGVR